MNFSGLPTVSARQRLVQHGAQEVLLPRDPVEVAVEEAVAHPDVLQSQLVLQVHPALVPLLVEPGLFDTAFAATDEHPPGDEPGPFDHLQSALDNLVEAGVMTPARRPDIEYPIWASVHGLAVLLRGLLSSLPERDKTRLEAQVLAFIGAAVRQP